MLSVGDSRTLTAVVTDSVAATIDNATVTWSSSAPTVVSVSPTTGLSTTATAQSNGTATITAVSGTVSGTKPAAVQQKFATVGLIPAVVPLNVGGNQQLTASAHDARGNPIPNVTGFGFSSNNEPVATVTTSGFVSAVANGTATITASLTRDLVTASATSTVNVTTGTSFPTSATVTTSASEFSPASVDILRDGTVTWTFGPVEHTVNFSSAGAPANIPVTNNASVARTFSTAGTFPYLCTIHAGMTGTVIVH